MADKAHRLTDEKLEEMEKRLSAIYSRAGKTGFTLDIASLSAPRYIKFCVKGAGANLTATLAPK